MACRTGDSGSNWRRICCREASREWIGEPGFGGGDGGDSEDSCSGEGSYGSSEGEVDEEGCMAEGMLEPANERVTLSAVVVGVLRPKGRFRIGSLLQIRSYRFWWAWVLFRQKGKFLAIPSSIREGCFVWNDNSTEK